MHAAARLRSRQRGFLMMEAMLALVLMALAAVATQRAYIRSNTVAFANVQGDALETARRAINFYIFENYITLQNDLPVTKNSVTLAHGTSEGQSRRPTIANLRDMGYLPATFGATAILNQGTYRYELVKTPAGCAGAACAIDGRVWIDQPFRAPGSPTNPDGLTVSTIMLRIGGNSAGSFLTAPGVLTGAGGSFTLPNPVPGAPAGVVGVRVGFNAEVEAAYVRIGDIRDPNLAGNLTVAGQTTLNSDLTVNGDATVNGDSTFNGTVTATGRITSQADVVGQTGVNAGTGAGGCFRSSIGSDGRIVARRANCTDAVTLDPNNSRVTVTDGASAPRVVLDGQAGQVAVNNATGISQVRLDSAGTLEAMNSGGTATATLNGETGRATLQRTQLTTTATAGSSCAGALEGDVVLDADSTFGTVVCRSGVWRRPGLPTASAGGACSNGALGQDNNGVAYICRANQWTNLSDRVTRSVLMARYLVGDGTVVPHPACGATGVPAVLLTPVDTMAETTGTPVRNRYAGIAVAGTGAWTVRIRLYDSTGTGYTSSFNGAAYGMRSIAQTFCDYPS